MAEKSDSGSDSKSEEPSSRRLTKAREEGSIARSRELAPALMLLVGAAGLAWGGGIVVTRLEHIVTTGLRIDPQALRDPQLLLAVAWQVISPGIELVLAFGFAMAAITAAATTLTGGFVMSWNLITPDFSRLDPMRGLKRLVSREALVELLKSVTKLVVVAAIVYWFLSGEARAVVDLARAGWPGSLWRMSGLLANVFLIASFSVFAVALIDVPYRIWSHRQDLRMSYQERREEAREVEGNPHTKRRLRMAIRKLARMRMMTQVPSADVVLVNPVHVSVALRYVEGSTRPPKLVAKGAGRIALHIREVAAAHGVPIVEAPPLARALNRFVEIEDEIPVSLYRAVAEVLAFVYRVRAARDAGEPDIPVPQDGLFDPPEGLRV